MAHMPTTRLLSSARDKVSLFFGSLLTQAPNKTTAKGTNNSFFNAISLPVHVKFFGYFSDALTTKGTAKNKKGDRFIY